MDRLLLEDFENISPGAEAVKFFDLCADSYDLLSAEVGYQAPRRCAKALAKFLKERDKPILDLGCGTGLSGLALAAEGFSIIDGWDPSAQMLRHAEQKGVYRVLRQIVSEKPLKSAGPAGACHAIVAVSVLCPNLTHPEIVDQVIGLLPAGGLFCFSVPEMETDGPAHKPRIDAAISDGRVVSLFCEDGPHLLNPRTNSSVCVLRRL